MTFLVPTVAQVRVDQDLEGGGRVTRQFLKTLDRGYPEVPAPGDAIQVVGAVDEVEQLALDASGGVHVQAHSSGRCLDLLVEQRYWRGGGVTLVCSPCGLSADNAIDVLTVLPALGFKELATA